MKTITRIGIAATVTLVPVGLYVATAPRPGTSLDAIDLARSLDADLAESAPQQTVVNGWQTNDLLAYMADQQDAYSAQQNVLLLVIALLCAASLIALLSKNRPSATMSPAPASAPALVPSGTALAHASDPTPGAPKG